MHSRRKKPLGQRILVNLRTKWAQVILSMIALSLVVGVSYKLTAKKKPVTEDDKSKVEAEFKFMHCDFCMHEMVYSKEQVGKKAMACRCKPGEAGYWEPTKTSVKNGIVSPYRWFYTAAFLETLVWLWLLVRMLGREEKAPDYYFVKCVHCGHMLRYRASGFDALIECPNCEQWVRLPDADEARGQEDHQEETAEKALSIFEARLRESGHVFPGEDPSADPTAAPGADPRPPAPTR